MKLTFKPDVDYVDDKPVQSTAEVIVDLSSTHTVTLHLQDPPRELVIAKLDWLRVAAAIQAGL